MCTCIYILYVCTDLSSIKTLNVRFSDTQSNCDPAIPYDGAPFLILGKKILECHQGPNRDRKTNEKKFQQCKKNVCIECYCCNLRTKKSHQKMSSFDTTVVVSITADKHTLD